MAKPKRIPWNKGKKTGQTPWNKGRKMSPTELKQRSEAQKKLWRYADYREHMSEVHKGQKSWNNGKKIGKNPEHSEFMKEFWKTHEHPKGMKGKTGWSKGKHWSAEMRKKLSESHKGLPSPMKGKKTGKPSWNKGISPSEKTKEKQKKSLSKTWSNPNLKKKQSEVTKKGMDNPKTKKRLREIRATRIFPVKDSGPEVKIQNFLKQLKIKFITHKYIKEIKHAYQCDLFVKSFNLIIEVDGDYWHGNVKIPKFKNLNKHQIERRKKDKLRTKELREKGYNVLRLWESDIEKMVLEDFVQKIKPFKGK